MKCTPPKSKAGRPFYALHPIRVGRARLWRRVKIESEVDEPFFAKERTPVFQTLAPPAVQNRTLISSVISHSTKLNNQSLCTKFSKCLFLSINVYQYLTSNHNYSLKMWTILEVYLFYVSNRGNPCSKTLANSS